MSAQRTKQEERNLITSVIVGMLIALAVQESVAPVRQAAQEFQTEYGTHVSTEWSPNHVNRMWHYAMILLGNMCDTPVKCSTAVLFVCFALTCLRFGLGNILHLVNEEPDMTQGRWICDFLFILLESGVLVFMGGVVSLEASKKSPLGFVDFLTLLVGLDVLWIIVVRVGWGRATNEGKYTRSIPWQWLLLSGALLLILLIGTDWVGGWYSKYGLWVLFAVNIIAFGLDVIIFPRIKARIDKYVGEREQWLMEQLSSLAKHVKVSIKRVSKVEQRSSNSEGPPRT